VYWVDLPDVASSVRNIQIQRGAGTSTNGAAAFGASVNMATVAPSIAPYAEASAGYGMYNTHKESISLGSGRLGKHWTVDARLSNIGTDGYIDRATVDLWSYFGQVGYYNNGTALKLLAFGGKEETYMAWDYASKDEIEKYGRRYNPCGEYTDKDGNIAYYPNQKDDYILHNFQLVLNQAIGNNWTVNSTLFYSKGDGFYEQYKKKRTLKEYGLSNFTTTNADVTGVTLASDGVTVKKADLVRKKSMDNGFGGLVASLNYNNKSVNATLGGSVNNYRGHHFGQVLWVRNYVGSLNPLQEYYRNMGEKFDANIFARANVELTRGLSVYGDLQYRHISYDITGENDTYDYNTSAMQLLNVHQKFDFFNPKAGLNWKLNNNNRAFASWSVAHREPARNNYTDSDDAHQPNAERLFDYELGYGYKSSIFSAEVNLYYMDYKDQLVATGQLSDTGAALSVNVPESYRMGVELQAAFRPLSWLEWTANATLSRNRIKNYVEFIPDDDYNCTYDESYYVKNSYSNTPISFSPGFIFNTGFNFDYKGFDAALTGQYVGKQYLTNVGDDDLAIDPYFVCNLNLGYTLKGFLGVKEMRVGFLVYNLFNEKYESNGYGGKGWYENEKGEREVYSYSGYSVQAPTNVMGTITMKF
jgi:iron complex outermembrane receptor protein